MDFKIVDYFSHGASYEQDFDTPLKEEPRSACCKSCAFTNCKGTVRPKDVSLNDLIASGDFFDVFYCHEKDTDGNYKICATWNKLFGDVCLSRHEKTEKEIETILNS